MAKTGEIAVFALGEKTAMVNLPAQFITSGTADMKGQKYSDLVDYANNAEKTSDLNNESINDLIYLKEQFNKRGYANRNFAVTETHPILGREKLNYDNHDISVLRKNLNEAQEYDVINIEDQGVMHKGQRKWSENKEDELRKRLANQLYKYLAQIEDTSINDIDQQMTELLSHVKKRDKGGNVDKTKIASSPQKKIWMPSRLEKQRIQIQSI